MDVGYQCSGWSFPENMDFSAVSKDKDGIIPDFSGCDFSKVGNIDFWSLFGTEQYVTCNFEGITITEAQFEFMNEGLRWDSVNGGFADGASYIYVITSDKTVKYVRQENGGGRFKWVVSS